MAKEQRGRRGATGTTQKQAPRASAGTVQATSQATGRSRMAAGGDGKASDAWIASIVFGTQETKIPVNIRLDADVVRYFRDGGPGYQTRINEILRAFVAARIRAGDSPGAPPKPRGNGRKKPK